jgi:hypothetical protein
VSALKNFINNLKRGKIERQVPKGKPSLTKEFLLGIPQNLRQQEIFFHICDYQIDKSVPEEFEQVSKLPKAYQMITSLWHLQREVNNGGYHQYFFNFENCNQVRQPYYNLTSEFLGMIGCNEIRSEFLKALELYIKCEECENDAESASFAEEMYKLDIKFYENERFFIKSIDDYIQTHIDDFVSIGISEIAAAGVST